MSYPQLPVSAVSFDNPTERAENHDYLFMQTEYSIRPDLTITVNAYYEGWRGTLNGAFRAEYMFRVEHEDGITYASVKVENVSMLKNPFRMKTRLGLNSNDLDAPLIAKHLAGWMEQIVTAEREAHADLIEQGG